MTQDTSNNLQDELRLVLPILYAWFAFWVILLICLAESGGYLLVLTMFTWSGIGLAMTLLWCSLYCPHSFIRDAIGFVLIVIGSAGSFWMFGWFSKREDLLYQNVETVLAIFLVTTLASLPCWFMRRFLGWQIARFANVSFEQDRRIEMRELFVWTAASAAFLAFLPLLMHKVLPPEDNESITETVAFVLISTVGLPSLAAMIFFTMLSVFGARASAFLLPFGSAFLALLYALTMTLFGDGQLQAMWFEVGWDATYCWSLAGYAFLAVTVYLQSWGIYCKVGFGDHRRRLQIALEEYERSVQEAATAWEAANRIDTHNEVGSDDGGRLV